MVNHMRTFIVTAKGKGSHFPQDVEEGYNVMREMQQVLLRVFERSRFGVLTDP